MRRFLRRKKKLIIRIALILVALIFIILLISYIHPESGIDIFNKNNPSENTTSPEVGVVIEEPTITVSLPEYITTVNENTKPEVLNEIQQNSIENEETNTVVTSTTGTNGKTYSSYLDNSIKYFITVLSPDNKLTIMLSDKAKSLLPKKSKIQTGVEYDVSNIKETIVAVYDFMYSDYKYPILLLLSSSSKLYYIDLEASINSGNFKVSGPIKNIPKIYKVIKVNITEGDKTYKSAVLTDLDGIGYEFTLDMINK